MLPREPERGEKDKGEETDGHDGGWKKVGRKGKDKAITSFYVSNLQEDVNVPMIRNAVKSLGFEGVTDNMSIVNAITETRCGNSILQTNVAKYEKRSFVTRPTMPFKRPPSARQPQHPPNFGGTRTGISFAAAVSGNNIRIPNPPIPPPPPPITPPVQFKPVESMMSCNIYCLTGEVVDINILEDLHVLIHADEHISARTYYAGGLRVFLKFIDPKSAEAYLKQKHKWNRWFTYLKFGFIDEPNLERLARVKITGIPVHLRSDENITAIASKFGKVLTVDGHNWHAVDLSVGFTTILTSSWKLINAEVKGAFNDVIHTIGVIENDNSWEPLMDDSEEDPFQPDRVQIPFGPHPPKTPTRPRSPTNSDNTGPLGPDGEYGDSYIKRRRLEKPGSRLVDLIPPRQLITDFDPPTGADVFPNPIDLNVALPCKSRSGTS
ncbi:hypothetical protein LXL04_011620 [Taraxacum kok-saghyz]